MAANAVSAAGARSSPRISQLEKIKAAKRAEMAATSKFNLPDPEDNREGRPRAPTGLVFDERMLAHRCTWDPHHIETPQRLARIWDRCQQMGLVDRCQEIASREATDEELLLYHTKEFIQVIERSKNMTEEESEAVCSKYDSVYLCPETAEAARLASGAAVDLVAAVLSGEIHNGLGLVRPPGHHAMEDELNGFCGYNNVVIAAKKALDSGINRILIVDFDLHHGQGTQRAFYADPRVLYMSVHRYEEGRFWPHLRESNFDWVGEGEGLGFNVNLPLNVVGCGPTEYLAIFNRLFLPIATEYRPELVIVSAGYDAAIGCPEGCMRVSPAAYAQLVWQMGGLAGGRQVVMLEGGYCLDSLAESAALTLKALLGDPCPSLPKLSEINPSVLKSLSGAVAALRPYWKCLQFVPTFPLEELDAHIERLPSLAFHPPPDFPPETYPTRDYYLVFDAETEERLRQEIGRLLLGTRLRMPRDRLCWLYDEAMCRHADDEPHPECPERIVRIYERLKEAGLLDREGVVEVAKGRKLTEEEALLVHDQEHWTKMMSTESMSQGERDKLAESCNSIFLNKDSLDCALLAAGGVLAVVDHVLAESRAGLAVIRPPGHHAEQDCAMGFCLFNNMAIAAEYALSVHGLQRVLILDWDVHHGNGIQNMFYDSARVLYISLHRYDGGSFFPGKVDAAADRVGEGAGTGFNINIPWNSRKCGDLEYYLAFTNIVMPVAYEFSPELVLVSAGFDAAEGDPLGGYCLSPEMYGYMTHQLSGLAEGRVVLGLEGGYNLSAIAEAACMCTRALLGDPLPRLNLSGSLRESVVDTLKEVVSVQAPYWTSLRGGIDAVPADVGWLADKEEERAAQEETSPLVISMSRAELKASMSKQGEKQLVDVEATLVTAAEEQLSLGH